MTNSLSSERELVEHVRRREGAEHGGGCVKPVGEGVIPLPTQQMRVCAGESCWCLLSVESVAVPVSIGFKNRACWSASLLPGFLPCQFELSEIDVSVPRFFLALTML